MLGQTFFFRKDMFLKTVKYNNLNSGYGSLKKKKITAEFVCARTQRMMTFLTRPSRGTDLCLTRSRFLKGSEQGCGLPPNSGEVRSVRAEGPCVQGGEADLCPTTGASDPVPSFQKKRKLGMDSEGQNLTFSCTVYCVNLTRTINLPLSTSEVKTVPVASSSCVKTQDCAL